MHLYTIPLTDINGEPTALGAYEGQVILLVNVASQCGFTKQYTNLQALYEKYKDKGLVVIGIPANEFGAQEPGTDAQILDFCSTNYNVSFPMMSKIVVKGEGQHPLFAALIEQSQSLDEKGEIEWNFEKFLIDGEGKLIGRFRSGVSPDGPEIEGAIKQALRS